MPKLIELLYCTIGTLLLLVVLVPSSAAIIFCSAVKRRFMGV